MEGENKETSHLFVLHEKQNLLFLFCMKNNLDGLLRSPKQLFCVIPVEEGIQSYEALLDSLLRGSGDRAGFQRIHQP